MTSIGEAVAWGTGELVRSGVESAPLTAQLLLGHVLGRERVYILSHPEQPLDEACASSFVGLIRRRAAGEPHQYLVGAQEFYGRSFEVNPAVLIPRPETEILVERAVTLAKEGGSAPRIVDVGTGSGCIAVTLACECPHARIVATDISAGALAVAARNARRHAVPSCVNFLAGNLLEPFAARPLFDLVLSNPPYVSIADAGTLSRTVVEHEPPTALFAGESGLEVIERLIPQARERLVPGGWLLMEIGMGQASAVCEIVFRQRFDLVDTLADLQGIARCLVARRAGA